MLGRPFIGLEGERGDGGERAAGVVRYNGSGGSRFRRGLVERWGVMREGGAARACAREAAVAVVASRPREEDDRRGSWLGWPKAEAQWRVAAVAQWEGKGEWAGCCGR
jgi:hypothetical protein